MYNNGESFSYFSIDDFWGLRKKQKMNLQIQIPTYEYVYQQQPSPCYSYIYSPYIYSPYIYSPYTYSPYTYSPYTYSPYIYSPCNSDLNGQALNCPQLEEDLNIESFIKENIFNENLVKTKLVEENFFNTGDEYELESNNSYETPRSFNYKRNLIYKNFYKKRKNKLS